MSEKIAGIEIPDTRLAAEATALVREAEPPLLFDHSRRVYLFGMLQGLRRGLKPDLELLYVGAMFHDLGLTQTYRTAHQRSRSTVRTRRVGSLPSTGSALMMSAGFGRRSPYTQRPVFRSSWSPRSRWSPRVWRPMCSG